MSIKPIDPMLYPQTIPSTESSPAPTEQPQTENPSRTQQEIQNLVALLLQKLHSATRRDPSMPPPKTPALSASSSSSSSSSAPLLDECEVLLQTGKRKREEPSPLVGYLEAIKQQVESIDVQIMSLKRQRKQLISSYNASSPKIKLLSPEDKAVIKAQLAFNQWLQALSEQDFTTLVDL
jgi:hypothetical protein